MKNFILAARWLLINVFALVAFQASAATGDWKPLSTDSGAELNSISCPEPRVCYLSAGLYLSGGTGMVLKTEDGGVSFSRLQIPTSDPLHGISCPTARVCYAAGDFGTFLKTEDGGVSWSENRPGSRGNRPHLTGLIALDQGKVITIGRDGVAYRTADSGNHWMPVSLRITADLYSIYFTDALTGFISGNDGTLLKTEDAGQSWKLLRGLKDAGLTLALRGSNNQTLFAVGDSIQKSVDGGNSWTSVSGKDLAPYRGIAVADASTAYALSGANTILKSIDSGATWVSEASFDAAFLRDIVCPSVDFCLAVGGAGRVFKLGDAPEPPPPPPSPPPAPSSVEAAATTTATTTPSVASPPVEHVKAVPVVIAPEPTVEELAKPEVKKTAVAVSAFTRSLKKGFRGADVKQLQSLLAGVAGIYPDGEVTGFFGAATQKAVGMFQEKYGIAKPGEPGYGEAGPKTRAKLIEAASGDIAEPAAAESASSPSKPSVSAVISKNLKKGARGNEVKKLQELLAADSTLYPEGDITGYFGSATARAVGRFQEKYGIANPGEPGYGDVGPKTRAALAQ